MDAWMPAAAAFVAGCGLSLAVFDNPVRRRLLRAFRSLARPGPSKVA
jgi:hypothetical protein